MIARPTKDRSLIATALSAIDKDGEERPLFWKRLSGGQVTALELLVDGERVGCLILSAGEYDYGRKLFTELYLEPGTMWREGEEIWSILEQIARHSGCESVVYESSRPGWKRAAPRWGFQEKATVTRYERQVNGHG